MGTTLTPRSERGANQLSNLVLMTPKLPPGERRFLLYPVRKTLSHFSLYGLWLSVAFLSLEQIEKLNSRYRHRERPTDILSFPAPKVSPLWRGRSFLGELLVAPKYVLTYAHNSNLELSSWCCRILIHGMLHLLGYDHKTLPEERRMQRVEEKILNKIPPLTREKIAQVMAELSRRLR